MRWMILIGFLCFQVAGTAQAREASERPQHSDQSTSTEKAEKGRFDLASYQCPKDQTQKRASDQRPNVPFNSYGK